MLQPGARFAGYRIVRRIGAGGMGIVYLAEHPRLPRQDVLKLLPADHLADAGFRGRFDREAELAARLRHPNIVTVHDRGVTGGQPWIAMEYVPGTDAAALAGSPQLGPRRAAHIIDDAARGLDHAHRNGMLHRDVKPANILVTADPDREFGERALLTDFGIARLAREGTDLTRTGDVIATVSYAAPEQFSAGPVDHRADVYALGCALFVLLTGEKPFPVGSTAAIVNAHLNTPPPAASRRAPGLSPAIDAVLYRALAKNPADRYDSCRAFSREALRALESPYPAEDCGAGSPEPVVLPAASTPAVATTETRVSAPDPQPPHLDSATPPAGPPGSSAAGTPLGQSGYPPRGPNPDRLPSYPGLPHSDPHPPRSATGPPAHPGARPGHSGGPASRSRHDPPPPGLSAATRSLTSAGSVPAAAADTGRRRVRKRPVIVGAVAALLAAALATTAVFATDNAGSEVPGTADATAPGSAAGTPVSSAPGTSTPVSATSTAPAGSGYTETSAQVRGDNGEVSWNVRIPQVSGGTAAVVDRFNNSVRAALQDQIDNAPASSELTSGPPDELHIGPKVLSALLTTVRKSDSASAEPKKLLATITINAGDAEPITLRDLFPDLDAGLARLSGEAERRLPGTPAGPDFDRREIQPRTKNFHHWVATGQGMAIHFEEDSVAPPDKGLVSITVPWRALADVLDPALAEVLRG
ncbi:serine/threonine-protein kinase [Nocardia flavorosea]|uniref:non-specific serine/threonine protein kinase n=1 Tax=Nocardia flavorosea TaxID=53429 RepID=A0A846YI55_9NOCA|nr:serine/threonine-protein kinase [Nocardia flavorosea]NKY57282.1 protein kinase [Nocardia flavorosea]